MRRPLWLLEREGMVPGGDQIRPLYSLPSEPRGASSSYSTPLFVNNVFCISYRSLCHSFRATPRRVPLSKCATHLLSSFTSRTLAPSRGVPLQSLSQKHSASLWSRSLTGSLCWRNATAMLRTSAASSRPGIIQRFACSISSAHGPRPPTRAL